jgi:hypothetical protein
MSTERVTINLSSVGAAPAFTAVDKESQPSVSTPAGGPSTAELPKPAGMPARKPLPFKPTTNKHGGSNALLLYNVPVRVSLQQLHSLFHQGAGIVPWMLRVPEPTGRVGYYKTMAYFTTPAHADLAFNTIKGPVSVQPAYGLLQKPLFLGAFNSDYVWLRKSNWPWLVELADKPAESC